MTVNFLHCERNIFLFVNYMQWMGGMLIPSKYKAPHSFHQKVLEFIDDYHLYLFFFFYMVAKNMVMVYHFSLLYEVGILL